MRALLLLLLLAVATVAAAAVPAAPLDAPKKHASVVLRPHAVLVRDATAPENSCASASLSLSMNTTGWNYLQVVSNPKCSNKEQMYAAGFAEGALTWQEMWWFSQNENTNATLPAEISTFLEQQQAWTRQMAAQYGDSDPYWHHVGLLDAQMQGLIDGYRFSAPADKQLPDMAIYVMTLGDDIDTLYDKFGAGGLRASEVADMGGRDHCSALVRLLPDNSEVFVSQVTWASFTSMLRIFKHYSFPLTLTDNSNALVAGVNISFSSYPGCLFSGDDYYQMAPSMLVNLETTIGNDNPALWKYVVPQSVFDWQRNMVSNRLAHSGAEWAATFTKYASGTYLNEFLTFDFKLFTPGRPPQPGALWILDEIPGNIRSADVTSVLISQGYFPSYNIPYFPDIYNLSGLPAEAAQYGAFFTYDMCPRAQIFRRNASDVVDLSSMQRLMRYNNFLNDPLAACDCKPLGASGENAVAARCDLNPPDGTYPFSALGFRNHVGTDAKIVSSTLIAQGATSAQSGPTYDQQPVFVWSQSPLANTTHLGQPDRFQFPWVTITWH